jgi:hypothetical protein
MKDPKRSTGVLSAATIAAIVVAIGAMPAMAAVDACTQTTKLTGGTSYTSDGVGNEANDGNHELWHDGSGSMKMTVYGKGAAFKAEWNNAGDFLARVGYRWGTSGKSYTTYGNVVADYNFTKSGSGGGYSYIGIYGWTRSPLVEYYVCESGFWTTPPNASALGGATSKGSFTIDGSVYDLYTYKRVNKPSIDGTSTFDQFWSVRRTPRTCGHISLSEHWKQWAKAGMTMGNMVEAKLLVEAGGGQGTFDLSYGTMQINYTDGLSQPEAQPAQPAVTSTGEASWANGKSGTVSLVSLNGSVIRSVHQDASTPAMVPTANLAKGIYLIRFQGEGSAPETRKFLLN